jgi:hypothetical protein
VAAISVRAFSGARQRCSYHLALLARSLEHER